MKFSSFAARFLTLVVALLTLLPATAQRRRALDQPDPDLMRKLTIAQLAVTQLYVDSVDQKKLVENAINGMLSKLDPHSAYSNPEETRRMNEPLEGNFEGIGVQFNMLEDTLVVIQTIAKGPSQKAGIVNGDRIVSVDGRPIAGVKLERDSIMKLLRGPKGTKVKLGIVRPSVSEPLTFVVTRDKIPMNTLDAAYMIAPGVGYIRLDRFGATSGKEVRDAIQQLKKQGMKDLLLDLESNGGGYLGAAVEVASQFLNPKDLVVYTEGRATPKQVFDALSGGLFRKGRLVVLVDEFSASAAEIVTGAVQDHDRGLVVGRRTFGKGLVQRPIDLPDGSMIRLTTSHYFTPSGRCIQKPYVPGQKEDYSQDLEKRFKHGELIHADSIHLDSSKVYHTLVEHRKVYGGGGIMPDVFVPLDTAAYTKYYLAMRRYNLFNDAVLRYVDKNRATLLDRYKRFDDFEKNFEVPAELIARVEAEAAKKKVTPKDEAERKATMDDLKFVLKCLIAYDVWDRNEYYTLVNRRNDVVKEALRQLTVNRSIPAGTRSR